MRTLILIGSTILSGWFQVRIVEAHGYDHHGYDHHAGCSDCAECANCGHSHVRESAGSSRGSQASGQFARQVDLDGRIAEVIFLPGSTPEDANVQVRVAAASQTMLVRLAPAGLLKQSGVVIREGEALSIRGFMVATPDGNVLVAADIEQGNRRVTLRDSRGRPSW